MQSLSTYYLQMNFPVDDMPTVVESKGPIIVQDDVWIAKRAIVLSGVTLGQGCIVAAGAVVTHDVAPYSIVAGVPARVTAMRFSPDIVRELELWADYSKLDEAGMKQMRDLLRMDVSADTLPLIHQLFVDSAARVGGSSGPKRGAESLEDGNGNC